jgi:ribonuclease BN (tRNA processing enzyme)
VEVRLGERTLILDAGTGIIPLGRELVRRARLEGRPLEPVILLSHLHHDHTQGIPFFVPAYLPNARLHVYGPGASAETLGRVLEANQSQPTFPVGLNEMAAAKDIRSLREGDVVVLDGTGVRLAGPGEAVSGDAARVRIHRSYAHPGGVYVYRVEWRGRSLVYATDTEGYVGTDRRLAAFAKGADLLVHDAQYSEAHYGGQAPGLPATQGYGHSTAEMACDLAVAAGVGTLILFHHDPGYDDAAVAEAEARARARFPRTVAAFEGLELAVGGRGESKPAADHCSRGDVPSPVPSPRLAKGK